MPGACMRGLGGRQARQPASGGNMVRLRSARGLRAGPITCAAHKIAVLPGDGIGPEIMKVARSVLDAAARVEGEQFEYTEALIGGAAIDAFGSPYPAETEAICKAADSVLLAAIGGCVRIGVFLGPKRSINHTSNIHHHSA